MRNRLILLPGWGLGTAALQPLAASLRAQDPRLQVELAPLPELAESRVQDWVDFLDRKLPTDAWLGGWSFGGMLASALASKRGDRCCGLLTLASNPSFVARRDWPHGMAEDTFGTFLDGCRSHPQVTLKRFRSLCSEGAQQPRTLLRQLGIGVPDTDPLYLATGLEVLAQLDTRQALEQYCGPQLHLYAGNDALVPADAAKALSEWLPDVEVGLVEDSAHAFLLEYPQELASGIKRFLHESGDD
ncbi:alpha/beta fold hydrolase [Pseudomonas sp. S75]|uniref:alpha/beta fold hydrolase n=1 Tax=unclassified Pseudomonas TaxID=196821 RepID=UPI0019070EF1|nr:MULTISPECIES: alpha/beta fold hydrolase [unclassified Pseudomonas]MBJ9976991.1 alpha/beta fold hydrolase [Pseudomonas sp. S30]MBK0154013.1 alpha/beta fold hydrolase [Pseudomonas sp. S75]